MSYYCCNGQEFQEPNFYWVISDLPTSLVHFEDSPEVASRNDRLAQENIEILAQIKEIKKERDS